MNIFKKMFARKESRTVITFSKYGNVKWTPKNYTNYAEETYMKNVIAFRCMDYKAKSVASVPWKLFKQLEEGREMIKQHPIIELIKRPNPQYSWQVLMIRCLIYFDISGNSFFEKVSPDTGPNITIPQELYNLRPDKFKIEQNDKGQIIAYIYDNSEIFEVDPITGESDIKHIKSFHPTNDIWGLSTTEPTAREIDSSNDATEWNKKVLENEGRPGMIIMAGGGMNQKQYDRLEKHLRETYEGAANAGKTLILESTDKIDAKPYNWNPKEMDFIEGNRELARRVCLGYGVPPQLLGIPGDSTYSNYKEARQAFWEETVLFYLNLIKSELNNWFFPNEEEKLYIDFVLDDVPALEPKRTMLWDRAQKSDFLTVNEKREMVKYEKIEGGDVILTPATMIPLEMAGIQEEVTTEQEDEDEENKLISQLEKDGYTNTEAREMLGLPIRNNDD